MSHDEGDRRLASSPCAVVGRSVGGRVEPDVPRPSLLALLDAARAEGAQGETALRQLLERVYLVVKRHIAVRLDDGSDAEEFAADVAQETLVILASHLDACRATSEGQFVTWVTTVARNRAMRMLRDAIGGRALRESSPGFRRRAADAAGRAWRLSEEEPSEARLTLLDLVFAEYADTDARTAEVMYAHLVEGATWKEAGHGVGTTAGGAKSRFHRARERIRRRVLRAINDLPPEQRERVRALISRLDSRS